MRKNVFFIKNENIATVIKATYLNLHLVLYNVSSHDLVTQLQVRKKTYNSLKCKKHSNILNFSNI